MAKIDMNMISTKFVSQAIDTVTEDPTVYEIFRHYNFKQDSSWNKNSISSSVSQTISKIFILFFIIRHSVLCEKYTKKINLVQTRNVLKESIPHFSYHLAQTHKVQMSQKKFKKYTDN